MSRLVDISPSLVASNYIPALLGTVGIAQTLSFPDGESDNEANGKQSHNGQEYFLPIVSKVHVGRR